MGMGRASKPKIKPDALPSLFNHCHSPNHPINRITKGGRVKGMQKSVWGSRRTLFGMDIAILGTHHIFNR